MVPSATVTKIESRIHYSLSRDLTNTPISTSWTRHANDLQEQTLRRSHRDDPGPKSTWWHTSLHNNAGTSNTHAQQRWSSFSFHLNSREMHKQVASWSLTNHTNVEINSDTNRLTYSSEQKITNIHIKNGWTRQQNVSEHTPNIVATTSRPPWSKANLVAHILAFQRWNLQDSCKKTALVVSRPTCTWIAWTRPRS